MRTAVIMTTQGTSPDRSLGIVGPYIRLRVPEVVGMYHHGLPLYDAVYLALHAYTGDDDGPWASNSTAQIATVLGVSQEQVSNAVKYLKDKNFIKTRERGHNGKAATYDLLLVAGSSDSTATGVGGNPESPPTKVACSPESPATFESDGIERDDQSRLGSRAPSYSQVGGNPESPPKRTFKEGSFGDPSCPVSSATPMVKVYHRPSGRKPRELYPISGDER